MTTSVTGPTREEFADRLLKGSVRKSYAPVVDIDWEAPLDPDKFYLPPKTISLYGTAIWQQMTRAQRIELSRQEFVNTLSAGIWFENILNQALLRDLMHRDPTARAAHYALTELGDETRHMVMFGKAIERVGATPVRPRLYHRVIINALPLVFKGSLLWVAALIGEEIFDSLQRQMMDDPELQPMVQRLMRIHVTEEARHIQFARDGVRRRVRDMPRINKVFMANINGIGGLFFRYLFTSPAPYKRAGLPVREARLGALTNPHYHQTSVIGFAPLAAFLEEVGLMGPIARRLWRRSKFLPSTSEPKSVEIAADEIYDGPATLTVADEHIEVRVRLTGHVDPIDGKYHWQGTVFDALPDARPTGLVTLTVDGRTAQARITEQTPWGSYSIAGTGAPPFSLQPA
ncbi:MAG: diiron oxygenase [Mycobacteriaceae bacterium]|nr:diiron oxygenase [Mycobacteriaceae bacterium]